MEEASKTQVLRVGIIGCGEVSQVVHIPTLGFLGHLFKITYLCDVSADSLTFCKSRIVGGSPLLTKNPEQLCSSSDVDVVFVVNSNEYHVSHTLLALKYNKHVFVEKPMALNRMDASKVVEAEKHSEGRVFVGYMRRYATAFQDAVKEIGGLEKIHYARVRDIIGPNSAFVGQSATFSKRFSDFSPADTEALMSLSKECYRQALASECEVAVTPELTRMWRSLCGLGSHDLSAMREALGMPTAVLGASLGSPFWNVLFQYPGFAVSYESGTDNVNRFDAHIQVYSPNKTVKIQYDTPYIKGLPITMHIQENVNGSYKETMLRKTYEDAYTQEMIELHSALTEGKSIKTTPEDFMLDLEIFQMIIKAGNCTAKINGHS